LSTPTNIYEQLRRDEKLCLKPYRDIEDNLSIGIGRNLDDVGISEGEAMMMLSNDVVIATAELSKNGLSCVAHENDSRFGVLLNMAFNMGISRLLGFRHMLDAYRAGDYDKAAQEMLDSKWATQVGDRAERLAKQMREGVWV
jgi:lysozyme